MAKSQLIERLRAGGILEPRTMVTEARRVGLPLPVAAALLEKESSGGRNVFGSDPGSIFIGAGTVTEAKYLEYRKQRRASGNKLMQGVGPTQLTWWSFQDDADREGGCWRPEINMRVGFRRLANLIKANGLADGAREYNGSGPDAVAYSKDLVAKIRVWEKRLAGLPVASASNLLELGDSGPLVVKLTRRLSYVRRKGSREAYLDGARKRLDAEAQAAVRAFQADHGLKVDGVAGPKTAHKLNRAVALEKARRKKEAGRPAQPVTRQLPALIEEVKRLDAETDRAWTALTRYGRQRRRLLARVRGGQLPAARVARRQRRDSAELDGIMAVLLRMEASLAKLVKYERKELAAELAGARASSATKAPVAGGAATAPGGAVTAAAPPQTSVVTEAAPPAGADGHAGPANGAAAPPETPPPPAPPAPRRRLEDLSDAELLERVERLDRALGRARSVLIDRYAKADAELAALGIGDKRRRRRKPGVQPQEPPKRKPAERPDESPDAVRRTQKALNAFVRRYAKDLTPLQVDGKKGPLTRKRILEIKHLLGYPGDDQRPAVADEVLLKRAKRPRARRYADLKTIARGIRRRRMHRKRARKSRSLGTVRVRMASGAPHWGGSGDLMVGFIEPFMLKQGLKAGSGKRTPAENARVGGSKNSDHLTTKSTTAARDFPTFSGEAAARKLARAMGIRTWQANSYARHTVTAGGHSFTVQILWGASIDHADHVHVGVSS